MVRLFGVVFPDDKRLVYGLTLIYGVGWKRSAHIMKMLDLDQSLRCSDLSEDQIKKISNFIEKAFKVEGNLREEESGNVKRLKETGCYRGLRHIMSLPSRGQRTRSNARTKKGKKKTVGAFTKEAWAKLETSSKAKK